MKAHQHYTGNHPALNLLFMKKFYLPAHHFKIAFFFFAFGLMAFCVNAQTTITTGSTVAASTIPVNNTITINAGGTLNMDVARTFASITTAGTGISNITGAGLLSLTGSITLNSTNSNPHTLVIAATSNVASVSIIRGTGGNNSSIMGVTVNGILKISSTVFAGASGTNNLTCNAGSIVEYNGAAQTAYPTTYSNLTLSGSGIKTLTGVSVNAVLSMQGTATASVAPTYGASSTLEYKGSSTQTTGLEFVSPFTGSGGVVINNASGVTLSAARSVGANPFTIGSTIANSIFNDGGFQLTSTGTLNLNSGFFNIGSAASGTAWPAFTTRNILAGTTVNYTANVAQTIAAVNYANLTISGTRSANNVTLANSGTIGISGVFNPSATYTTGAYVIASSTVSFNGTAAQAIPAFTFNSLIINNTAGISSIAGNVTINNSLALTNGIVSTGSNKIILISGASSSRTNGWVNGNFQKYISTTTAITFEIGDASNYSPVTVNYAILTTAGNLTATVTTGLHPAIASSGLNSSKMVNRYWTLTSGGVVGSYDAIFTFVAGDILGGANTLNFLVRNYNGASWATTSTGTKTSTSTQATGLTTYGDLCVGEFSGLPTVSTQPSNSGICLTSNASFTSASLSAPGPTVQWQRSSDGGTNYINIIATTDGGKYTNFTNNTLTVTAPDITMTGYLYRSVYTNINGSVNSNAATLTITQLPTITTFSYTTSPFANISAGPENVTLAGTNGYTGGTYTSDVNLTINATTGAITPSSSTLGNHIVTYSIAAAGGCGAVTATTTINITTAPTAVITYSAAAYCISDATPRAVTLTGTGAYTGGAFSVSPGSGLSIDAFGTITPNASTAGSYIVTYTIPAGGGFLASDVTTTVTITPIPTAAISYTGGPFCSSDQTENTVIFSGTSGAFTGGLFSSSPAGLVLNTSTGAFTPNGSSIATYTITYTIAASGGCAAVPVNSAAFSIVAVPTATISYNSGRPLCQAFTTPQAPIISGATGGSFSFSPAGLVMDGAGAITPSTSIAGDYDVVYTIPASGPCGIVQITTTVTISETPTGSISYPFQPYCTADGVKAVTLTGTGLYSGGTYSSTAGLSINTGTGSVTPATTTPNTYNVTYNTPNACPVSFTTPVEIIGSPTATISYASATFCSIDGSSNPVTITGAAGGIFSSSPLGLSLDGSLGDITPSASTPGTYLVSYTILGSGTCPNFVTTRSVTITPIPTATISYAGTPFCTSLVTGQAVSLTGTNAYTGGTFSAPAGLTINTTTGAITPSTSTAGTYTVTYTIASAGGCAAVPATTSVTITAVPTATVTYSSSAYCIPDVSTYTANVNGTGAFGGGSFSSAPAGLSIDASGIITPGSSAAGNYTITYTVPSSSGCAAVPVTASVTINADATIALSSAVGTDGQTKCINTAITNITYAVGGGGTGATITAGALPSGVTGSFNAGVFTITGTPSASGTFNYTVTTSGPCVNNSLSGTITVTANSSISRTSAAGTDAQIKCINTAITDITYGIAGGGTGASITAGALPTGVTGTFNAGVFTITGTPSVTGTFNYTVTTSGPCVDASLSGTITVNPNATITLTSAAATTAQTICIGSAITPITYNIGGGGSGATFSGLPAGVTGLYNLGVVTISGTPTLAAGGIYNYTVTTTGTCTQAIAVGSITVSPTSVGGTITPSQQIICQNATPGDLTLGGGYVGTVVRWQKSTNISFALPTNIAVTNITLTGATIGALATSTYFRAEVQSGSCSSVFSGITLIAVNPPFYPVITATPSATICLGQPVTLTSGGFSTADTIIGGNFDNPKPGEDGNKWEGMNGNSGNNNNFTNNDWGRTNDGKTYLGTTYSSPTPGNGFMVTSGTTDPATLPANESFLSTPVFSSVGKTSLSLQWNHGYSFSGGAVGRVEISIDGGTNYTTLVQYNSASPAIPTNPFSTLVSLNLDSYLGQTNLKIRFYYIGSATSSWAIDNVNVIGPYQPINYTWPSGFTVSVSGQSATITPTAIGPNVYTITTSTGGCAPTSVDVTVTVNPLPTITTAATPAVVTAVCQSASAQTTSLVYTATTGSPTSYSIDWATLTDQGSTAFAFAAGGGTLTGISIPAGTTAGTYTGTMTITNGNGCTGTKTITLTVNPLPTITTAATPAVVTAVCQSASAQTTAMVYTATTGSPTSYSIDWATLTDQGSTAFAFAAGGGTLTGIAIPAGTIAATYTGTMTITNANGCTNTQAITIVVNTVTVPGSLPANISVCTAGTNTITLTGQTGSIIRWESSINGGFSWSNITNTTASYNASVVAQTTLYRVLVQSGVCPSDYSTIATAGLHNVWTGFTNTDWQTASNWSDGLLPTATPCADVIIPNVTNDPVLSSGTSTITNLIIQASGSVVINSTGLLTIGGTIITNTGTFDVSAGSLEFNGASAQSIAGNIFVGSNIKNLRISNTTATGLTLTGGVPLNILGELDFGTGNATLTTNDNLVLRSTATTTARVADITINGTGNKFVGKVTVERFYPGNRSWRLVTSPLSSTGNIFNSWQIGAPATYVPGKGMFVTGLTPNIATNGLDNSIQNNFSMKGWDVANSIYTNVQNTLDTLLSENTSSAANKGYFTFVRGDRSRTPDNTIIPNTNNTTLSSKGNLQTGTQTFGASLVMNGFTLIGNPYASPVDMNKITRNNVAKRFTVWDPNLVDVGAFVVMADLDNDGVFTPVPASGQNNYIQSSQAFFVQTATSAPASIVFEETHKSNVNNLLLFRPTTPVAQRKNISINLYKFKNGTEKYLADGNYAEFDDQYSSDVTIEDAPKFTNINETFGLQRNNKVLAIELRPTIKDTDTLFLKLTKSTRRNYRLEFIAGNLAQDNLAGFVEDKYLNQLTAINLDGSTTVDFQITADAGSAAADRFKVIFKPSVIYTDIKANMLKSDIAVEWNLPSEYNIKEYEIERSTNGTSFTKVATKATSGNSNNPVAYQWLDLSPSTGEYYYRIRSVSHNNVTGYSNTVKVIMNRPTPSIYVFPNPVTAGIIQLQMNSMPQGVYAVRLINNLGQAVLNKRISHGPGTSVEKIQPDKKLVPGIYHLEVLSPDRKNTMIKVNVQ